jgi:hypothetical protein
MRHERLVNRGVRRASREPHLHETVLAVCIIIVEINARLIAGLCGVHSEIKYVSNQSIRNRRIEIVRNEKRPWESGM